MNMQKLNRIYIIEPNQHIEVIDIPDNEHHYVGYITYIQKQMKLDPRLKDLEKFLKIRVTSNNAVLVSNKIFKHLEDCGYFVIQTWYLNKEKLFYMKHSRMPQSEHMKIKITTLFQTLGFSKEHFIEEYKGHAIYQRNLEFLSENKKQK